MGQTTQNKNNFLDDWEEVKDMPVANLYRHAGTGELAQKHVFLDISFGVKETSIDMLKMRTGRSRHIAGIYGWRVEDNKMLCSSTQTIIVLTEYIPTRLTDIPALQEMRALQILLDSMDGFMSIYRATGAYSKIDANMIGISEDQVKVWVNPNYGDFRPYIPCHKVKSAAEVEQDLINDLLAVIEHRVQEGKFSPQLVQYLKANLVGAITEKQMNKIITKWLRKPIEKIPVQKPKLPSQVKKTVIFSNQPYQTFHYPPPPKPAQAEPNSFVDQQNRFHAQNQQPSILRMPLKPVSAQIPPNERKMMPMRMQSIQDRVSQVREINEREECHFKQIVKVPEQFRQHFEQYLQENKLKLGL